MKIAVIAANGRLGKVFVEEALANGHDVTAGIRGESRLTPHSSLTIMQCDATQIDDVTNLIKEHDIVVSCIGHVKSSRPNVQTAATKNIVTVMEALQLKRFIDVTGTGVRFPDDKITFIDRILNLGISVIDPSRVKDGQNHQKVLLKSDLDWTTIRILKLQNVPVAPYELRLNGPTKIYVGRREVARAMLTVINNHSFIKQAPIIGYIDKR